MRCVVYCGKLWSVGNVKEYLKVSGVKWTWDVLEHNKE